MTDTLTNKIRLCQDGVVDNPYQGTHKKILFVCSAGILRSATAARIYAHKHNTRCAGTGDYALIPLTERLCDWADQIVFVNTENFHNAQLLFDFAPFYDKSVVLNIPDKYEHMHDELIAEFHKQYEEI